MLYGKQRKHVYKKINVKILKGVANIVLTRKVSAEQNEFLIQIHAHMSIFHFLSQ